MPLDNIDIKSIIAIMTFLAGAGSAVLGMLKVFASSERKRYAAERDFQHLRGNQEQMKQSIALLTHEVEELQSDLKTQTALFQVLMSNSGQTISGIFARRDRPLENQ